MKRNIRVIVVVVKGMMGNGGCGGDRMGVIRFVMAGQCVWRVLAAWWSARWRWLDEEGCL